MGKRDSNFIIILDIDKIFSSEELELVQDAQETAAEDATGEATGEATAQ